MKIDTSKIENFESMSAEEKLNALMGYEFEEPKPTDNNAEITKLKKPYRKNSDPSSEIRS